MSGVNQFWAFASIGREHNFLTVKHLIATPGAHPPCACPGLRDAAKQDDDQCIDDDKRSPERADKKAAHRHSPKPAYVQARCAHGYTWRRTDTAHAPVVLQTMYRKRCIAVFIIRLGQASGVI